MMRKSAALIAVGCAGLLSACGAGSSPSTTTTSATASKTSAPVKEAQAAVNALYGNQFVAPSNSPRPQPGKKLVLISCGQSITACSDGIGGAAAAAAKLGWQTRIVDTKGDLSQAPAAIQQAIVSHADGIFLYAINCTYIKQALEQAQQAHVPVVAAESLDCNPSHPLFSAGVSYVEGPYSEYIRQYGIDQAKYIVAKTNGDAKVIVMYESDDLGGTTIQEKAQVAYLKSCATCTVYEVPYTINDLSTGLQQKVQQALVQHPDANVVVVQYDAVLLSGVAAGVQASGKKVLVMAAEGDAPTLDLVRSGKVTAGIGIPIPWEGWAGVDDLNRLFHGQQPVSSGIALQFYDAAHNLPKSGRYVPPVDFPSAYAKAWGVK
jgi:ribose transport system substrate-binding protein